MRFRFYIGLFILCLNIPIFAQIDLNKKEQEINLLFDSVAAGSSQHVRFHANEQLILLLDTVLNAANAFDYSFSNLKITILKSSDNRFRMFNWMVPNDDGTYEYAAFAQYRPENSKAVRVVKFADQSYLLFNPEQTATTPDKWFGAIYSEIITEKANDKTIYTLLGWNGNSKVLNKRVIEVVSFKANGDLVMGQSNWFLLGKDRKKRMIFEYNRKSSMLLRYDKQSYTDDKKLNSKSKEIKTYMIIFDRLIPKNPDLAGQREHYIAGGGVYDAFIFENEKWVFKADVKARNPEKKKK